MRSGSGRLLWTWLPTALGSSVLVAEIPLVAASVARSRHGADALAALGIAISVIVVVNTPGLAMTPLVVSEAGRQRPGQLAKYGLAVGCAAGLVLVMLATVPSAFALLRLIIHVNPVLAADLRACLLALAPASIAVAGRRYLHGRLIVAAATRPITVATVARMCCSGALAWSWVAVDPTAGALGGGFALTVGAYIEFAVLVVAARRIGQSTTESADAGQSARPAAQVKTARLVSRHAQLSCSLLLNMVPALITTAAITHSKLPAPSLVVWPALYGLLSLFTGPTLDWESVTAAALRRDPADSAPGHLTWWLSAGFGGLFTVMLLSPAGRAYIGGFIGVPAGPAHLGLTWAPLLIPAPALSVIRSHARGRVIAARATRWLVYASIADVIALTALSASLSYSWIPGVACGSIAIVGGIAADAAVTQLGARQRPRPAAHAMAERPATAIQP